MTFFKRGLRALLPAVLTLVVILIVYNFFDEHVVRPVNRGIETFLVRTSPGRQVLDAVFGIRPDDEAYVIRYGEPGWKLDGENVNYELLKKDLGEVYPSVIGIVVALSLIFIAGSILATIVGRRVLSRFEGVMGRFPIVKTIYPYARQVVEFFTREKTVSFHSVVAVHYPRHGLYSLGFVTGLGMKEINKVANGTLINVFVPSAPTPFTGWVVFVAVEEVIPLPISVDDAIRLTISCGVLIPEDQRNPDEILARFEQLDPPSIKKREGGSAGAEEE